MPLKFLIEVESKRLKEDYTTASHTLYKYDMRQLFRLTVCKATAQLSMVPIELKKVVTILFCCISILQSVAY